MRAKVAIAHFTCVYSGKLDFQVLLHNNLLKIATLLPMDA